MTARRPKDIGTAAERAVVRYLTANGWPHAERRALRGVKDAGDITGTPGLCWSVKGGATAKDASDLDIVRWLRELEDQRHHAGAALGVLVTQRRHVGPANAGRWWAWLDGRDWLESGPWFAGPLPMRLHLADAVMLLRQQGYGDPASSVVTAEVT